MRRKPYQNQHQYQALLLLAISEGYSDDVPVESISVFEEELYKYFDEQHGDLMRTLEKGERLSKETLNELKEALSKFKKRFE